MVFGNATARTSRWAAWLGIVGGLMLPGAAHSTASRALAAAQSRQTHAAADASHKAVRGVAAALKQLDAWLGHDANAEMWRRYLRVQQLREQLRAASSGEPLDRRALQAVLSRFESDAPGLNLPRMVAVRDALRRWIEQLPDDAGDPASELPRWIRNAKRSFRAASDRDVRQARRRLRQAMRQLDRFLARGGAYGQLWREYLRWSDLQAVVAQQQQPNLRALLEVIQRYETGYPGLELPPFRNVGRAARQYLEALWAARSRDARKQYEFQIDRLAETIAAALRDPTTDRWQQVGALLGWFDQRGQAAEVVRLIRRRYSRPNIYLLATEGFISDGLAECVDETRPVVDVILGTCISGTGHTRGRVRFDLVPSTRQAALDAVFLGATETCTVGRNRSARIGAVGTTRIGARKRLVIHSRGLSARPARSRARTSTQITGIWSTQPRLRGRLVRRIAERKTYESKWQGEQIAARHAEAQFNENLDQRIDQVVHEANTAFWQYFREPLLKRGDFPQRLAFSTTDRQLDVVAMYAARNQLAAQSAPPPLTGTREIAVRLHESLIDNYTARLLGGVHLDQAGVRQRLTDIFGKVPERFEREDADREPWSITFARQRPVTVRFRKNQFVVVIRATEFTSGDRRVTPMTIRATYRLEHTTTALRATRSGDLEVLPPDIYDAIEAGKPARRMSVREQTGAALLRRRFANIFEPQLEVDRWVLPGRLERLGPLGPTQAAADQGWLIIGWRRLQPAASEDKDAENAMRTAAVAAKNDVSE